MSLAVHDLQQAIVEGKESKTQLLRKTKLIAAKLNLKDVEEWVDLELHRISQRKEAPRILRGYFTRPVNAATSRETKIQPLRT